MRNTHKFIFTIFLLLIGVIKPISAISQNYIPMLTDSLYWDIAYADMNQIICESFGAPGSGTFRYKLDTDTIIN